jgi:SAM-dependent methyltransferase
VEEKDKYEMMWEKCARYGKDWRDPGLAKSYKKWFLQHAAPGASVMDFGCGNGTSLEWLQRQGLQALGIDIAENSSSRPDVYYRDLRDRRNMRMIPKSDYGLCTDLMEHIPTEDIDIVLKHIAQKVVKRVLFGIARLPDRDGDEFGVTLHLTLKDMEWWDRCVLDHFKSIETLRYNEGGYIFWAIPHSSYKNSMAVKRSKNARSG